MAEIPLVKDHFSHRLLKSLGIKQKEWDPVSICFLFTFFIGLCQSFMLIVPLTLFLSDYSTTLLPYIYIGSAFFTLIGGSIYSYFQKKLTITNLLFGMLIVGAASIFIFWLFLNAFTMKATVFALIIWGWVFYGFGNVVVYNIVNSIFTLEQGKRLYGIIGAGQSLGGVVAGFLTPLLVRTLGTIHILILIALILLLAIYTMRVIKRKFYYQLSEANRDPDEKDSITQTISLKNLLKNSYLLLIFLVIILGIFEYYTVDILFNTVAQKRFPNEIDLGSFLGVFIATTDILNFLIGILLFGWLLEKVGLIISLSFLPIMIGLLVLVGFSTHFIMFAPAFVLIFGIVTVMRLVDETMRISIYEQSLLLLFQPLRAAERVWAQSKIETLVTPLGTVIIGGIILFFNAKFGLQINVLLLIILAICFLTVIVLWFLKNGYLKALSQALKKRNLLQLHFNLFDKVSIDNLRSHTSSQNVSEVLFVLASLEKANKKIFSIELEKALSHPVDTIKIFALEKIEKNQLKIGENKMIQIYESDQSDRVRSAAMITLCSFKSTYVFEMIEKDIDSKNMKICFAAIVGIIKYGSSSIIEHAKNKLNELVHSTQISEKVTAANIIGRVGSDEWIYLLLTLIVDDSIKVRKAACSAASLIKNEKLFLAITDYIYLPGIKKSYFSKLMNYGDALSPMLEKYFDTINEEVLLQLVKVSEYIDDLNLSHTLQKHINHPNISIRHAIIVSLNKHYFKAITKEQAQIVDIELNREGVFFHKLIKMYAQIMANDLTSLLRHFLMREIELSKERILMLLDFQYPNKSIMNAKLGLNAVDESLVSYAQELLLETLSADHKDTYFELLMFSNVNDLLSPSVPADQQSLVSAISEILSSNQIFYFYRIKAVAIFTAVNMHIEQVNHLIYEYKNDSDKVVKETYEWAIEHTHEN